MKSYKKQEKQIELRFSNIDMNFNSTQQENPAM